MSAAKAMPAPAEAKARLCAVFSSVIVEHAAALDMSLNETLSMLAFAVAQLLLKRGGTGADLAAFQGILQSAIALAGETASRKQVH